MLLLLMCVCQLSLRSHFGCAPVEAGTLPPAVAVCAIMAAARSVSVSSSLSACSNDTGYTVHDLAAQSTFHTGTASSAAGTFGISCCRGCAAAPLFTAVETAPRYPLPDAPVPAAAGDIHRGAPAEAGAAPITQGAPAEAGPAAGRPRRKVVESFSARDDVGCRSI